jgi:predicted RNA binding protein YcfA (HicA-like mRNA interferase family)
VAISHGGCRRVASISVGVISVLRAAGWRHDRPGKGDHEVWVNQATGKHVAVDGKILSRHTANEILKQAGLPKQF